MVEGILTGVFDPCAELRKKAAAAEKDGNLIGAAGHLVEAAKEHSSRGCYYESANCSAEAGGIYEFLAVEVGAETEAGRKFLCKAGAACLEAGDTYFKAGDMALARGYYDEAAKHLEIPSKSGDTMLYEERVQCLRFSGKCAEIEGLADVAGEAYERAARLTDDPLVFERARALNDYMNAMLAYARGGNRHRIKELYERFCEILFDVGERKSPDEQFLNKLIPVLDEQGLTRLAGKAYIAKMDFRFACLGRRFFPRLAGPVGRLFSKLELIINWICRLRTVKSCMRLVGLAWLAFWRITGRYGESGTRWLISSVALVLLFALLYTPAPANNGPIELYVNNPDTFAPDQSLLDHFVSAISFSVTVFTTLGFGDVVPRNGLARFVVGAECMLGYVFLGMLITILGRKMLRR